MSNDKKKQQGKKEFGVIEVFGDWISPSYVRLVARSDTAEKAVASAKLRGSCYLAIHRSEGFSQKEVGSEIRLFEYDSINRVGYLHGEAWRDLALQTSLELPGWLEFIYGYEQDETGNLIKAKVEPDREPNWSLVR